MNQSSPDLLYLLARLLGAPEDDALELLGELSVPWPWLAESFEQARSVSLESWQAEHTRLFLSGFPHVVCPPFASAYLHGHLNGSITDALRAFYSLIGLKATVGFEDFLGTMLECAARLIEQHNEARLQRFWSENLEPWVPRFTQDLLYGTNMQLYRDLARQIGALFSPPGARACHAPSH
ncbi:cytoplasmic chaperone TorD family protein [invertebrate metagenome]|uniref:Cytoplasmic chaperone TorD family protein n=1 Tax=invertebrate metagenome TaxID=1711999 RepID=A0A484HAC4_9ZZZZ